MSPTSSRIAIHKIVFYSMWREAALSWLVATAFEPARTYGLMIAGLVSLAAFTSGA